MLIIYFRIFGQFTNFIFLFNIRENLRRYEKYQNIEIFRRLGRITKRNCLQNQSLTKLLKHCVEIK